MHPRRLLTVYLWSVLVIMVMVGVSPAAGYTSKSEIRKLFREKEQAGLQGLLGVYPVISVDRGAEQDGPIKTQLKTDVELRLRKAGIMLTLPNQGATYTPPLLWVIVSSYTIEVQLQQTAMLVRDLSAETYYQWHAITWERGVQGTISLYSPHDIRDRVGDLVDEFINDYLNANPRAVSAPSPSTLPNTFATSSPPASSSPRRDLVRQVQERLQAVGFKPGAVDGTLGPQTREALRWFQNTKGLISTGEIDEKTLDALGVR
jgi:hypothetical protein